MREYLRDIYLTIKTILIGMRITLKYCFARTITVQYPDVAPVLQPRVRRAPAFRLDGLGPGLNARLIEVGQDHMRALGGEQLAHGKTQPAGRAGHKRDTLSKTPHGSLALQLVLRTLTMSRPAR
jgi:hypothetical protein